MNNLVTYYESKLGCFFSYGKFSYSGILGVNGKKFNISMNDYKLSVTDGSDQIQHGYLNLDMAKFVDDLSKAEFEYFPITVTFDAVLDVPKIVVTVDQPAVKSSASSSDATNVNINIFGSDSD